MITALLFAAILLTGGGQNTPAPEGSQPSELGIIAGSTAPPGDLKITKPIQVILLAPQYAELWSSDVQKRLDVYWERYKPAFAEKKEFFTEVSRMAYRESLQFVVNRMRRELGERLREYVKNSTPEGNFEFRNVTFGNYRVVAIGTVGEQEFIWQESVQLTSSIPQFIQLQKHVP